MRRMIGFLLGVLLLGVARSMRTGAWCLRGSAASGGHRTAALVGMGLGLARPVALMVGEEESPGVSGIRRGLRPRDDRPSVDSKTMVGHGVAGS